MRWAFIGRLAGVALVALALGAPEAHATFRYEVANRCARAASPRVRVPLTLHLTAPTADIGGTQISTWLQAARDELEIHGLDLRLVAVEVDEPQWRATRRARRRDLSRLAPADGTIHVFVVQRVDRYMRDQGVPQAPGIHFRSRARPGKKRSHIVLVTPNARTTTLAHELGHALGLHHTPGAENMMSQTRRGPLLRFTYQQGQRLRKRAIRLRQHRLSGC